MKDRFYPLNFTLPLNQNYFYSICVLQQTLFENTYLIKQQREDFTCFPWQHYLPRFFGYHLSLLL